MLDQNTAFPFIDKNQQQSMEAKENYPNILSPCMKKRVRICSLNQQKRRALTQCTSDLNIAHTSATEGNHSPKLMQKSKRKTFQSQAYQNSELSPAHLKASTKVHKEEELEEKNVSNSAQFEKLIEITSRCVDYYNKFIEVKDSELKVVKEAFADIHESLNRAFNGIITQVQNKHNEIKQFLDKKQRELLQIKQDQQRQLSSKLNDVKSVHLMNLLTDYKLSENSADLNDEICNYAGTLHKFYESMEKVEKQNFKQGVEQTINFINNVISEEIKFIIYEKIPSKSLNGSFSFNDGLGFGNSIASVIQHKIDGENASYEPSMVTENMQILSQKSNRRRKQTKEGWTQTLSEDHEAKQSLLQTINQITKRQQLMKQKILKYRGLQL